MNILITGNLTSLAATFAGQFVKLRHRVVMAAEDIDKAGIKIKNTIIHSYSPAKDIFREAMSAYGFDMVFFLATREEQLTGQEDQRTGHE
ncbi:MAG TPA: hypothetical protein VFY25_01540, partial [Anaerolineales bacterium]|nr:hypothetical protein [Anaerolineales bacterium]